MVPNPIAPPTFVPLRPPITPPCAVMTVKVPFGLGIMTDPGGGNAGAGCPKAVAAGAKAGVGGVNAGAPGLRAGVGGVNAGVGGVTTGLLAGPVRAGLILVPKAGLILVGAATPGRWFNAGVPGLS